MRSGLRVAYGCCVGSWDRFAANVLPRAREGAAIIAMSGQTSIADAYNSMLDVCKPQDFDMVILQHDDLEITDPDHVAKFAAAFDSGVHIAGVAGGSARSGLAWWNCEPIGHQMTNDGPLDFGAHEGLVDLLEGSILAFSYGAQSLRFSSRPGFHGYDEIAMKAVCAVVDVDTHHHTNLGFDNAASEADWQAADRWFRQKWGIK